MTKPTKINHIALAVTDMDAALAFWQGALGIQLERIEEVPAEKARVAFLPLGDSEIELVEPTADDTGLARYLEKRGPGIHHICVQVEDINAMIDHLKSKEIRLINPDPIRKPDGKQYAFIHPQSTHGVLVELYQLPEA